MLEIHQETGCRLCPRKCGVLREGIVTAPKPGALPRVRES